MGPFAEFGPREMRDKGKWGNGGGGIQEYISSEVSSLGTNQSLSLFRAKTERLTSIKPLLATKY